MWNTADRIVKMISDLTVGTVIVLVHVALAERESARARHLVDASGPAFEEPSGGHPIASPRRVRHAAVELGG